MNHDRTLPDVFPGVTCYVRRRGEEEVKCWVRTVGGELFATACFYTLVKMYNYMACWFKFVLTPDIKFSEERLSTCLFIKNQAKLWLKMFNENRFFGGNHAELPLLKGLCAGSYYWQGTHSSAWVTSFSPCLPLHWLMAITILKVKLWTRVLLVGRLRVWESFPFSLNSE